MVDEGHPDSDLTPYITVEGLNDLFLDDRSAHTVAMTAKTHGSRVTAETYVIIERDRTDDETADDAE